MSGPFAWSATLDTVGNVLTLLVVLVGLILSIVAYVKRGRSRAALLGAIGFLLMLLLSCCWAGWGIANRPALARLGGQGMQTYATARIIVMFLARLVSVVGLVLLVVAVWIGGRKG